MIRTESGRMAGVFDDGPPGARCLADRLNSYGTSLMEFMFSEEHLAVDRVLMNEIAQSPRLAERFYQAGPGLCLGRLAEVLGEAAAKGEIEVDDPWRAAEDLCGLWKGISDMGVKLGLEPVPSAEAIRARVERATRLFLRMVGSKP